LGIEYASTLELLSLLIYLAIYHKEKTAIKKTSSKPKEEIPCWNMKFYFAIITIIL